MALDSVNEKLALMEWGIPWEPGLPLSPSSLGQDDQQQLLGGYPGILWAAGVALEFVLDMNTRLMAYLRNEYSVTEGDLSTLVQRNLAGRTGEYTARMQALIADATAAMQ